jgi:hypothetical protein
MGFIGNASAYAEETFLVVGASSSTALVERTVHRVAINSQTNG